METTILDKGKKRKRLVIAGVSCLTVVALIILWNAITPFLIDNDNIYLKTIASGEMTGKPEAHMYYMGFLSGAWLSFLYSVTGNGIPWFGIFLCVCEGLVMGALLARTMAVCGNPREMIGVWGLCVIVFCMFFYHYFAKTQYTIATGFVGTCALFELSLLSVKERTKSFFVKAIPFLIFAGWSFGMRDKGFLMLLPFLGMTFMGKVLDGKTKQQVKNVFLAGALFGMLLLAVFVLNRMQYAGGEWKEFKEYTDASEVLFDFDGFPEYETNKELYGQMGIQRSSYEAITKHYNILLDPEINRDHMVQLAEVAERERLETQAPPLRKMLQVLKTIAEVNLLDYQDRPLNILVYLLYLFVVLLAIWEKKWLALRDVAFLIVARMFDWIYLVWFGRYPFRVTQIIYMAELMVLVAVILNHKLWETKKEKAWQRKMPAHPLFLLLCVLIIFSGVRFGYPVMKGTCQHVKGIREMSVCFPELEAYLASHPENFYYFDQSHLYYMEDTLSFQPSAYENYVYMGSWMPNSPWYRHKLERHGITDVAGALLSNEHVFILYQQVDFDNRDFLDAYFAEHYPGTEIRAVDTFTSSNGFRYEVLKPMWKEWPEN